MDIQNYQKAQAEVGKRQKHRRLSQTFFTVLVPKSSFCGLLVLGLVAGSACAQETQTKASKAKAQGAPKTDTRDAPKADKPATGTNATTDTVTVTGEKPLNRIDRQTYDNTKDPDSKTGTALDALAKVPGVSVDPSGAVTLRGKAPEILINGRPAAELQGDNRAAAFYNQGPVVLEL
jgi:hypothetical protein